MSPLLHPSCKRQRRLGILQQSINSPNSEKNFSKKNVFHSQIYKINIFNIVLLLAKSYIEKLVKEQKYFFTSLCKTGEYYDLNPTSQEVGARLLQNNIPSWLELYSVHMYNADNILHCIVFIIIYMTSPNHKTFQTQGLILQIKPKHRVLLNLRVFFVIPATKNTNLANLVREMRGGERSEPEIFWHPPVNFWHPLQGI